MSAKIRWSIYLMLLAVGIFFYFQQFFTESWMRWQLRNETVIIAFSTTPYRINNMQDTVDTILKQSLPVAAVYLSVPEVFKRDNIPYEIPEWLNKQKRISILRTEDYGPATKLLGVLEHATLPSDAIIITLDDDIKYPKNTVLQLAYKAYKNPDRAIAICGSNPEYDDTGAIAANSKTGIRKNIRPNALVSIAQGFAGVAYRKGFFNEKIFAINDAPKECINSDDVYISYYLAQQKIPRQILNNKFIGYSKIDWDNELSLSDNALHKLVPTPRDKHSKCISYLKKQQPNVEF